MALLELRGFMARKKKVWGTLPDRFIINGDVVTKGFAQLPLTDYKRHFDFNDFKFPEGLIRSMIGASNAYNSNTYGTSYSQIQNELGTNHELPVQDRFTPPLFFSSSLSGFRDYYGNVNDGVSNFLGYFKGPDIIFEVDNTGNAGDYIPPGTKLMVSNGGLFHKFNLNGKVEPLLHKASGAGDDPWYNNIVISGWPVHLGWHSRFATQGYYHRYVTNLSSPTSMGGGSVNRWSNTNFSKIIGQDASYIYYLQFNAGNSTVQNWQYNYSQNAGPDSIEIMSLKKSDSVPRDLLITSSHYIPAQIGGYLIAEVTTTEATPKKAILMVFIPGDNKSNTVTINKLTGGAFTNIGYNSFSSGNQEKFKPQPTRLMENKNSGFSNYWKAYFPSISSADNICTLQLFRQIKTLEATQTIVGCTITGLPAEYASTDGTKIRKIPQSINSYDACWAAEIYDGDDQYIAYWIGRTRNPWWVTNIASYSYNEVSDTSYRWFLVFKVDPTDDSKLIYQSCIPEFKMMNPIHCAVASPDNKHICVANPDGVYCFTWSTTSKSFVAVDSVALPGVVAMGMDNVNSADKNNVFVEVLDSLATGDDTPSYLYQISFGDYVDVDMRYWNGTTYVADFGSSTLPVEKIDEVWQTKTATVEVRVKNKVDGVETAFVSGKNVKLKISGVRDSDGVSFVSYDAGIPHQKTIVSGADWVPVQISYSQPLSSLRISSEILN